MATKRLPMVLCLDVSPSMDYRAGLDSDSAITLLNSAVNDLIDVLVEDTETKAAAEIAIVTFSSHLEMDTPFVPIGKVGHQVLKTVEKGGTNIGLAVKRSIEKIEERRDELNNTDTEYFAPFLVIVTDGNPDGNYKNAVYEESIELVRKHCDSHVGAEEIIVPFVIGVGDKIEPETLYKYSEGFVKGYIPIKGDDKERKERFQRAFRFIGNSTRKSVHLNASDEQIVKGIKTDLTELVSDLGGTELMSDLIKR